MSKALTQCGSVGWASSCKAKGCRFDSWSGHMPGLWVQSPVGVHMTANWLMPLSRQSFSPSFSFSPSLLVSLKVNKTFLKSNKKRKWMRFERCDRRRSSWEEEGCWRRSGENECSKVKIWSDHDRFCSIPPLPLFAPIIPVLPLPVKVPCDLQSSCS